MYKFQASLAPTTGITYRANRNLASGSSSTFTYDVENWLVVASGANTATSVYGPLNRLSQVVGTSTNTDEDELIAD
jgi:hypothetical protein